MATCHDAHTGAAGRGAGGHRGGVGRVEEGGGGWMRSKIVVACGDAATKEVSLWDAATGVGLRVR